MERQSSRGPSRPTSCASRARAVSSHSCGTTPAPSIEAMTAWPTGGPAAWIDHWARLRPNDVAVLPPGGGQLSYAALARSVASRAAALVRAGASGGVVLVAISEPLEQRLLRWAIGAAG